VCHHHTQPHPIPPSRQRCLRRWRIGSRQPLQSLSILAWRTDTGFQRSSTPFSGLSSTFRLAQSPTESSLVSGNFLPLWFRLLLNQTGIWIPRASSRIRPQAHGARSSTEPQPDPSRRAPVGPAGAPRPGHTNTLLQVRSFLQIFPARTSCESSGRHAPPARVKNKHCKFDYRRFLISGARQHARPTESRRQGSDRLTRPTVPSTFSCGAFASAPLLVSHHGFGFRLPARQRTAPTTLADTNFKLSQEDIRRQVHPQSHPSNDGSNARRHLRPLFGLQSDMVQEGRRYL